MKYVQILVDGVLYTLRETQSGEWVVTNRAPYISGEYPITVLAKTEAGQELEINTDDPELLKALTLLVTEGNTVSGERMLKYWPNVIQEILEFQAFIKAEGFEIDFLKNDVELSVNEAYLSTMGLERIMEWEQALGITPAKDDSVDDRRESVIARIRGQGKLNTELINSIVGAFTGGTANSHVENGVLYVKIVPPPGNKQYKFDNVVRELIKKTPAHLSLVVSREYATWKEISENYSDWNAIKQLTTWEDLNLYIAPQ